MGCAYIFGRPNPAAHVRNHPETRCAARVRSRFQHASRHSSLRRLLVRVCMSAVCGLNICAYAWTHCDGRVGGFFLVVNVQVSSSRLPTSVRFTEFARIFFIGDVGKRFGFGESPKLSATHAHTLRASDAG